MIDIEVEVFHTIASRIRQDFPGIYVTGEHTKSPPSFPCVSIVEEDNTIYEKSISTSSMENHASVMYEVNVYSNLIKQRKMQARTILSVVDDMFLQMGFTRTMSQPIPNGENADIYRIVARYQAVVSKDKKIYRR